MIILNEKKYVEELLFDRRLGEDPTLSLNLIAKYYRQYKGLTYKRIIKELNNFLISCSSDYNPLKWSNKLEYAASRAKDRDLQEISGVWLTQKELDEIKKIHFKSYEKLAFTLLCLAKYYNKKNATNNNWINMDSKEIFKLARITGTISSREYKIGELSRKGNYISFPKKVNNTAIHVDFVDNTGDGVLFISDFRELGYEYLKYLGENFIRCGECGILTRGNKNGTKKYCNKCMGYNPTFNRKIVCEDCGKEFYVSNKVKNKNRCDECYKIYRKEYWKEAQRKHRNNM